MGLLLPLLGAGLGLVGALWGALFALIGILAVLLTHVQGVLDMERLPRAFAWVAVSGTAGILSAAFTRLCWRRYERLKPPTLPVAGHTLGGAARRLGACGIDSALLIPLYALASLLPGALGAQATLLNLPLLPYFAYVVAFTAWRGRTLGKQALGLRVLSVDGSRVSWLAALRRSSMDILWSGLALAYNARILASLDLGAIAAGDYLELAEAMGKAAPGGVWLTVGAGLWYLADLLCLLVTPERRSLHDYLAGTVVVVSGKEP
jgi:uncharacterized RDD family membrane protein YckC